MMELGTIVFYQHRDVFDEILLHMKAKEQALSLDDKTFEEHYTYSRQALFHILYQSNGLWGFVCHEIKRRDGSIGYKILNKDNSITEINKCDIYFALKMDDFTYTHWTEMKDKRNIKTSSQGTPITKKPSDSSIKKAKMVTKAYLGKQRMLYQIVSLEEGNPYYSNSHPFNSQWNDYDPYRPSENPFSQLYEVHLDKYPTPYSPQTVPTVPYFTKPQESDPQQWALETERHYFGSRPIISVIISSRPHLVSCKKWIVPLSRLSRMFVNFPQGFPDLFRMERV